jgi:hypothetical protein
MANPAYMTRPIMITAEGRRAWTKEREVAATRRKKEDMASVQEKLIRR